MSCLVGLPRLLLVAAISLGVGLSLPASAHAGKKVGNYSQGADGSGSPRKPSGGGKYLGKFNIGSPSSKFPTRKPSFPPRYPTSRNQGGRSRVPYGYDTSRRNTYVPGGSRSRVVSPKPNYPAPPAAPTEVRRNAPPSKEFRAKLRAADAATDYEGAFGKDPGDGETISDKEALDLQLGLGAGDDGAETSESEEEDRTQPEKEEKKHFSDLQEDEGIGSSASDSSSGSTEKSESSFKKKPSSTSKKSTSTKTGGSRKTSGNKSSNGSRTKRGSTQTEKHLGTYNPDANKINGGRKTANTGPKAKWPKKYQGGSSGVQNPGPKWIDVGNPSPKKGNGFDPSGFSPYDKLHPDRPGQQTGNVTIVHGSEENKSYVPDPFDPKPGPTTFTGGIGVNLPGLHDKKSLSDSSRPKTNKPRKNSPEASSSSRKTDFPKNEKTTPAVESKPVSKQRKVAPDGSKKKLPPKDPVGDDLVPSEDIQSLIDTHRGKGDPAFDPTYQGPNTKRDKSAGEFAKDSAEFVKDTLVDDFIGDSVEDVAERVIHKNAGKVLGPVGVLKDLLAADDLGHYEDEVQKAEYELNQAKERNESVRRTLKREFNNQEIGMLAEDLARYQAKADLKVAEAKKYLVESKIREATAALDDSQARLSRFKKSRQSQDSTNATDELNKNIQYEEKRIRYAIGVLNGLKAEHGSVKGKISDLQSTVNSSRK